MLNDHEKKIVLREKIKKHWLISNQKPLLKTEKITTIEFYVKLTNFLKCEKSIIISLSIRVIAAQIII